MYQKGIEQGNPDPAAAIGVVLVIVVLLISLVNRRSWSVTDMTRCARPAPEGAAEATRGGPP